MNIKHTPAPWILKREGWDGQYIYGNDERVKDKERFIAEVSLYYDGAEANARLISCAPEMLDFLIKDVKEELETHNCDNSISVFLKWFIKTPKMELIEKATGMKIEEVLNAK